MQTRAELLRRERDSFDIPIDMAPAETLSRRADVAATAPTGAIHTGDRKAMRELSAPLPPINSLGAFPDRRFIIATALIIAFAVIWATFYLIVPR